MALSGFKDIFAKQRTFRPKKKFSRDTVRYDMYKLAQASLGTGIDLRETVKVPADEDPNDWIAVHVFDFYNRINLIYGTVRQWCTDQSCSTMSGGKKFEYLWRDNNEYKKPTALPAPLYVEKLMEWIESQINNPAIFPPETGVTFPKKFLSTAKKIFSRLFRVFVHVYIHHFDKLHEIGAEAHINTCYKHFYYFITYHNLIDRDELQPLVGRQSACMSCGVVIERRHPKPNGIYPTLVRCLTQS